MVRSDSPQGDRAWPIQGPTTALVRPYSLAITVSFDGAAATNASPETRDQGTHAPLSLTSVAGSRGGPGGVIGTTGPPSKRTGGPPSANAGGPPSLKTGGAPSNAPQPGHPAGGAPAFPDSDAGGR